MQYLHQLWTGAEAYTSNIYFLTFTNIPYSVSLPKCYILPFKPSVLERTQQWSWLTVTQNSCVVLQMWLCMQYTLISKWGHDPCPWLSETLNLYISLKKWQTEVMTSLLFYILCFTRQYLMTSLLFYILCFTRQYLKQTASKDNIDFFLPVNNCV